MKLLIFSFLLAASFCIRQAESGTNFTTLSAALEDVEKFALHFNATYNFPSLVFGLSVKGKSVFRKAWGNADLENWVPAKLTTKYRIASISKTFTSVLVGRLVDKGLVKYDDPISKYLPESVYPKKFWKGHPVNITIRHLLSHQAGTHITDVVKDFFNIHIATNVIDTIAQFANEPLLFEPGSQFLYSNYGFQLLGAIIESVTKQPFLTVLTQFFTDHNLTSSYVGNLYTILHDSARHYMAKSVSEMRENVPSLLEETFFVEGYWPAGGIVTTVDDLLKYGQLLIDAYHGRPGAVLSKSTLLSMWHPQTHNASNSYQIHSEYGLGWCVALNNPTLKHEGIFWHAGGLPGVSSMLMVYPEEEVVGVALVNKGGVLELDQMIVHAVENVYGLVK